MRMPAEQQVEIGMRRLPVDLGRMRQQDRKFAAGKARRGLFDVVGAVVVSIVDPDQMDVLVTAFEGFGLVEQHADAHLLERGDHADRVVVAQHAVNRPSDMLAHPCHTRDGRVVRPEGFPAIVAGQHAKIIGQVRQQLDQPPDRAFAYVDVQVADME